MINKITSVVMAILGGLILYMAVKLIAVGGSPFYAVMAIGFILTAIVLFLNKRIALSIYAILMWLTLFWIIYEVGFDKWQWIPRGDLVALMGLWLALPWVVRGVYRANGQKRSFHPFLGGTVIVMMVIVVGTFFYDPYPTEGTLTNTASTSDASAPAKDWTAYGGSENGQRYSALDQINAQNVKHLKLAWTYHTGDLRDPGTDASEYTFEATPLKVNDALYFCTPHGDINAVSPETGKQKWRYSPARDPSYLQQHQTCRGVAYFYGTSEQVQSGQQCSKRVFSATSTDPKLIALDADTGKPCEDFGDHGVVDLQAGLGKVRPHAYMQTAAPLVAGNAVIVGGSVMDNGYASGNPSGVIRAYDVHTGQLLWNFDPARPDQTAPLAAGQTYTQDTPVAWGTLSADVANNIVYVPFGNASPDQLGLNRDPNNPAERFRDALVALDLRTGALKWSFQTSYHDLWDRDNPSQPTLMNINYQGNQQPAVILPTKTGNIFVLNRLTGKPIYPVHQQQVSTEGLTGEKYSPTQPVSSLDLIPPPISEASMWGLTPFDQMQCRTAFKSLRYDGNPWTPFTTEKGAVVFTGDIGTFNWGSVAVDPDRQLLVAAPVSLPYAYHIYPRDAATADKRIVTKDGKPYWNENFQGRYAIQIDHMQSGLGIPCNAPPWGSMVGVDLTTGKVTWKRRIGTTKNLKTAFTPGVFPIGFPVGMVAHGGEVITKGGLVFQAATADDSFRAYDVNTGKTLWQTELPAGGQATPSTYLGADGKQYVVITAGGHGSLGTTEGDSVMAFTLE